MTLADAFRLVGPPRGDAHDAERAEAIRVLDAEIRRIARRIVGNADAADDVASDVTIRLVAAAPGTRHADFNDAQTRGFLARTVRNVLIDGVRAAGTRRRTERAFVEQRPPRPRAHGFIAEAADAVAWAERCVDATIIPAAADAMRSRRAEFERDLELLRALHAGLLSMDEAVAAERKPDDTEKRARGRLHTRCSRTRARLGVQALKFIAAHAIDPVRAGAIEVALAELGTDLPRIAASLARVRARREVTVSAPPAVSSGGGTASGVAAESSRRARKVPVTAPETDRDERDRGAR